MIDILLVGLLALTGTLIMINFSLYLVCEALSDDLKKTAAFFSIIGGTFCLTAVYIVYKMVFIAIPSVMNG